MINLILPLVAACLMLAGCGLPTPYVSPSTGPLARIQVNVPSIQVRALDKATTRLAISVPDEDDCLRVQPIPVEIFPMFLKLKAADKPVYLDISHSISPNFVCGARMKFVPENGADYVVESLLRYTFVDRSKEKGLFMEEIQPRDYTCSTALYRKTGDGLEKASWQASTLMIPSIGAGCFRLPKSEYMIR